MKKMYLTFIAMFLISNVALAAESVFEWGSWQEEEDIVAAILAGADPAEVTQPTAAGPGAPGTVAQAIVPVAFDNVSITQEGMPKEFGVASIFDTGFGCADARLCQEGVSTIIPSPPEDAPDTEPLPTSGR